MSTSQGGDERSLASFAVDFEGLIGGGAGDEQTGLDLGLIAHQLVKSRKEKDEARRSTTSAQHKLSTTLRAQMKSQKVIVQLRRQLAEN